MMYSHLTQCLCSGHNTQRPAAPLRAVEHRYGARGRLRARKLHLAEASALRHRRAERLELDASQQRRHALLARLVGQSAEPDARLQRLGRRIRRPPHALDTALVDTHQQSVWQGVLIHKPLGSMAPIEFQAVALQWWHHARCHRRQAVHAGRAVARLGAAR